MANIAQTVNVLQAMVLTEGDRMVLTPTYHVFEMYKGHQGAQQLECYAQTGLIGEQVPQLHASASRDAQGSLLLTVANLSEHESCPVTCFIEGADVRTVCARVLSGDAHAHNTFDAPHAVEPRALDAQLADGVLTAVLPPCSVCAFALADHAGA